jgi:hypothetical protein
MVQSNNLTDELARVRVLRANPPGRQEMDDGARPFGAALEQFEQLLSASHSVGAASAPILLFYALSQAGRAVVAAREQGARWQPRGHGLKVVTKDPVGATEIAPEANGLFQAVAAATDSGGLSATVTLSDVWGAIPRLPRQVGLGDKTPPIFLISQEPGRGTMEPVVRDERGTLLTDAHEFLERQASYGPGVAAIRTRIEPTGVATEYQVVRLDFVSADDKRAFEAATINYLDARYLRAPLGAGDQPSALMTWWVLLLALAQLARYEPAAWTKALDPDNSSLAVPIEQTLRHAAALMPQLVLGALTPESGALDR